MFSKLSLIALAATLAPYLASAFIPPSDLEDGVYIFGEDENGNDFHKLVGPIVNTTSNLPAPGTKEKRDDIFKNANPDVQCGDGVVTSYDYTSVYASLEQKCSSNPSVGEKHHFFVSTGGATAYMCNYGGNNPCHVDELKEAFSRIGQKCPDYNVGWCELKNWKKSYGYNVEKADICKTS